MGRTTEYNPEVHLPWAQSLAMEGLIDKEIAERMGVARSTLKLWEKNHPEFSDAIKMGKDSADAKVQQSLYRRATGYIEKEKKIIVEMDAEGNQKPARIETTEKHIVPDVGAICFWLKNRKPDDWRDKKDVEVSGSPFEELMKAATASDESKEESK